MLCLKNVIKDIKIVAMQNLWRTEKYKKIVIDSVKNTSKAKNILSLLTMETMKKHGAAETLLLNVSSAADAFVYYISQKID